MPTYSLPPSPARPPARRARTGNPRTTYPLTVPGLRPYATPRSGDIALGTHHPPRPRKRLRHYYQRMSNGTCRIIALGGLGEVGKNMTVYEADGEIVVVDAGLAFPRDEHLGVDLVLPDYTWLRERADQVRAVVLTHGHEDHVGGLPYFMRAVPVPEGWATRLTLGLIQSKLDEHGLARAAEPREAQPEAGPSPGRP